MYENNKDTEQTTNGNTGRQPDGFSTLQGQATINPPQYGDKFQQTQGKKDYDLRPKITVFGVGGAGGNAVCNMITNNLEGVDFVVANTDAQALAYSLCEKRIQLGVTITRGLGAGSRPDIGRAAADEAINEIQEFLYGSNMVFITAGMGGGTGTGAAPVIAKLAREQGILTIGVVTKPFHFEGTHRMRLAERGIEELQEFVDTLIVIPNQNLFRIANEKTTFADAFKMADNVLDSGVRGVTDLMVMPGLINLDFADIRSVMSEMGKAMMGTGESSGERRALDAAEAAISNPLLDDVSMKGAKGVLINITGGYDMTLYEVDEAANRIRDEVDSDANIIFGSTFNAKMDGRMRVSVVATGIDAAIAANKAKSVSGFSFSNSDEDKEKNDDTESSLTKTFKDAFSNETSLQNTIQSSPAPTAESASNVFPIKKQIDMQQPQKTTADHPKKRSLFERLTGITKFGKQAKEELPEESKEADDTAINTNEDLDIPTFLRKN